MRGLQQVLLQLLLLGADEVVMAENSLFMIHNAWGGTMGEAKDMRKTAETLDKISGELTDIYRKKTGLSYGSSFKDDGRRNLVKRRRSV